MSDDDTKGFEYKDMGLEALLKALDSNVKVKLGVLGGKTTRTEAEEEVKKHGLKEATKPLLTNAEVGLFAEFGTEHTPIRSWLRVPIIDNLQKYMAKAGAFKKEVIAQIIQDKSLVPFMRKVGLVGERIVQDGFDSGGFGKWPESNMDYKKNHQTLVETQQLRNSVTSEVEE